MHRFFPTIIAPLLEKIDPKTVIEIGCADGAHTRLLLDDCKKRHAVLHAVDPEPTFDVDDLAKKNPGSFVFHRMMSIDALQVLPKADVVLIDGDHNYFTVSHELAILCADPATMPVILLHDVGWPYGRRDMYHDPSRIPPQGLQHYKKKGLLVDGTGIAERGGGVNAETYHAEKEGGPRNGILTAIEDVIKTVTPALRFILVPGFHGLGILMSRELERTSPDFWRFCSLLETSEPIRSYIQSLEKDRYTTRYEFEREFFLHACARAELEKK